VSFLEYGSYLNAGTDGFAIMIASRWKRPSPRYLFDKRKIRYAAMSSGRQEEAMKLKVLHESVNIAERGRGASENLPGRQRF